TNATGPAIFSLSVYRENGVQPTSLESELPPNGWRSIDLASLPSLSTPVRGSAILQISQPATVVVDQFYHYQPPCAPVVTLSRTPAGVLYDTDLVTFTASATGDEPVTYQWQVDGSPVSATTSYSATFAEGQHTIRVTATNAGGSSSATNTIYVSCSPPDFILHQEPAGVIFPNDPIHFSLTGTGTPPLEYDWWVDGIPSEETTASLDLTLPAGDHTVHFRVRGSCFMAPDAEGSRSFTVVEPPAAGPDLSLSTLTAGPHEAPGGDELLYTAILRNSGGKVALGTHFSNMLPGGLDYVEGSAQASNGGPVYYDSGFRELGWTGDIDPGAPVMITYAARVVIPPPDGEILNTAQVLHGGVTTLLPSRTTYLPRFTLVINNGEISTNQLTIDLTFTYDTALNLTYYQLSEYADFRTSEYTTPLLPLNGSPQVHPDWNFDPYGDPRLPRTVYIKFGDDTQAVWGPFSASILFDEQPPAQPQVSLAPLDFSPAQAARDALASPMEWLVTTTDDNSGVAEIVITSAGGANEVRLPITGRVTRITWQPNFFGDILFRARDRSGNLGPALRYPPYHLYLPV
ncbi:MAG: PKD domain-containing protein, partial [Chloroflexi bacterium]